MTVVLGLPVDVQLGSKVSTQVTVTGKQAFDPCFHTFSLNTLVLKSQNNISNYKGTAFELILWNSIQRETHSCVFDTHSCVYQILYRQLCVIVILVTIVNVTVGVMRLMLCL